MSFRSRLESKIRWLRSVPNIHIVEARLDPPLPEATITQLHARLGFALDERYLAYFRECGGWSLRWLYAETPPADLEAELDRLVTAKEVWNFGRFTVEGPLVAGAANRDPQVVGDPRTLKFLGGITDEALRRSSYPITAYGSIPDADRRTPPYNDLLIHASATSPDPICYVSTDHYADLTNFRPMRARSLFELGLAFLGGAELLDWFEAKGFDGDHALVELPDAELPAALFRCDHDRIRERASASATYLKALGKRAGVTRYRDASEALPELPVVHPHRARYQGDGALKTGALLTALRELAIFDGEHAAPEVQGLRLVASAPPDDVAAYLCAWPYNKPSGPTDHPLETLEICDRPGARLDELRAVLARVGLSAKAPTISDDGEVREAYRNPADLALAPVLAALRDLGRFTEEDDVPVSWSTKWKNLRLREPSGSAWIELGPIGPPRVEGEDALEGLELCYGDAFPADRAAAIQARLIALGLTPRAWSPA